MIEILDFSNRITIWYQNNKQKTFPWQKNKTPYKVWISEIMLQQTQVSRVVPYFQNFIHHFPNIKKLAQSKINTILYFWSGLGYYTRAHNLHNTAKIIVNKYNSIFPTDFDILVTLPGIGNSTAGAILSLSLEQQYPILESNVKRILTRYYEIDGNLNNNKTEKKLWIIIKNILPKTGISNFNQGLMNLGETICTNIRPKCTLCPLKDKCKANLYNTIHLYPNKKTKKNIIKKNMWLLILQYEKKVWIEQCPKGEIWGGLFSFPQFFTKKKLYNWLLNHHLDIKKRIILPIFQHKYTHYSLTIIPIILYPNKESFLKHLKVGIWFNLLKPQVIGFPQPMLKLLKNINQLQKKPFSSQNI